MTLRKKTLLLLGVTLAGLLAVLYVVSTRILLAGFARAEEASTRQVVQGVDSLYAQSVRQLDQSWANWSAWDDCYQFIQDGNSGFVKSNLVEGTLSTLNVDVIAFVQPNGRLMFGTGYDQKLQKKTAIPAQLRAHLIASDALLQHASVNSSRSGLLLLPRGAMLVVSRPIVTSEIKGPIRGSLIVGRYLDAREIERVSQVASLSVTPLPFNSPSLPPDFKIALAALRGGASNPGSASLESQPNESRSGANRVRDAAIFVRPLSETKVAGYSAMRDIYNRPAVLMRVETKRDLYSQGQRTLRLLFLSLGAAGLAFSALALLLLEKLVLSRLVRLSGGVRAIRASRDVSARVTQDGADELSQLAGNINGMLESLQIASVLERQSEELYREMSQIARSASDVLFVFTPDQNSIARLSPSAPHEYSYAGQNASGGTKNGGMENGIFQWHGDVDSLLGYASGEYARDYASWLESVHPDDRERVLKAYDAACHAGGFFNEEVRMRRRDGSYVYWQTRGKSLFGDDGRMLKFIGACTDISERKQGEENLRQSQEQLARIIETNADAIIITDGEGQITTVNAAAESIFGLPRAQITQRAHNDAAWNISSVDGTPFPDDKLPFSRIKAENQSVYDIEHAITHPDGKRVVLSVNAAPLLDPSGAVSGMVASVSDVTNRRRLEDRLAHQAFHDALTGLPNRSLFLDRLQNALVRAGRTQTSVGVLFLDLDNFKFINDSLGHAVGDELLVSVARRLLDCLRASDTTSRMGSDTAARFGGDEFTLMLDGLDDAGRAVQIAQRVLDVMQQPFMLHGREVTITPSIGIALSARGEGVADELLRNADAAMYDAKSRGRARYELFQSSMGEAALRRLELQNDLRRAVERDELRLYYQPQVRLEDGEMFGVEALVRWQHPTRGLVMPGEFVPLAEESGQIAALGHWVLRESCLQARRWQREFPSRPSLEISVNLSVKQLRHTDLVADVAAVLEETGLDPNLLVLEITESVIMSEAESALAILRALKALGVRMAIDDFGTGYSSLAYLQSFPIDILKIDRQFVSGLGRNNRSPADHCDDSIIVASMINLAHGLGLVTLAEGVETSWELEKLKELDNEMAQGFLFSRPLPPHEISALLGQSAPLATIAAA